MFDVILAISNLSEHNHCLDRSPTAHYHQPAHYEVPVPGDMVYGGKNHKIIVSRRWNAFYVLGFAHHHSVRTFKHILWSTTLHPSANKRLTNFSRNSLNIVLAIFPPEQRQHVSKVFIQRVLSSPPRSILIQIQIQVKEANKCETKIQIMSK